MPSFLRGSGRCWGWDVYIREIGDDRIRRGTPGNRDRWVSRERRRGREERRQRGSRECRDGRDGNTGKAGVSQEAAMPAC